MGSLGQVHVDCLAVALVNVDTVKDGKGRMWQERVSPRGEGEKMKALLTAKVGMFLVVSSVLAVWTLLAAQPGHGARKNSTPPLPSVSCSSRIPGAAFFGAEMRPITSSNALAPTGLKGQSEEGASSGTGRSTGITMPRLRSPHWQQGNCGCLMLALISDAVLCGGSSRITRSITSYSAHNTCPCRCCRQSRRR